MKLIDAMHTIESYMGLETEWLTAVPFYGVGKKTEESLRSLHVTVEELGTNGGNSLSVAQYIIEKEKKREGEEEALRGGQAGTCHRYLYLCGASHLNDIQSAFDTARIPLTTLVVYSVPPLESLVIPLPPSPTLHDTTTYKKKKPWFVFFSPNGFKVVLKWYDYFSSLLDTITHSHHAIT
jgi:hypothetical protein